MATKSRFNEDFQQARASRMRASTLLAAAVTKRNALQASALEAQSRYDALLTRRGSDLRFVREVRHAWTVYKDAEAALATAEHRVVTAQGELMAAHTRLRRLEDMRREEEDTTSGANRGSHARYSNVRSEGAYDRRNDYYDSRAEYQNSWKQYRDRQQEKNQNGSSRRRSASPQFVPLSTPPAPKKQRANRITLNQIQAWHAACTEAFKDKTAMRAFPEPPTEPCSDLTCASTSRTLKACKCNIKKCFVGRSTLKTDRLQFHPDKFSAVPEDVREQVKKAAGEVFVVVNGMLN
ncbi:hypothetical protein LTR91_009091 [Friedmanniomyces endolithicus]|uniref:Uncharacterized protein n=1 Tax=Friedmanniomyces endolithicus TaxID=329885 RepID=A0AAN6KLY0_9PEZI|nr:hypothetical protein LTR35_004816 [Friedmanniomyces endolithicus]KAK0299282.1 hypothetical protein LTS00_002393 [Friedmanniomyces endolithicus]KAK0310852.1 hypothetical protein LTR82_014599 [Friedmanniomyces endolithicus]KAK0824860.1 hypothetical protein LTR73_007413 [Friedmanniomyces endolithicus]KAK0918186.1 hypothetical protein LTR57_012020 [Friedmanniomyces endolithicus]